MSAPPFRVTRVTRSILRVLWEQDDGQMNGLRIAKTLPRRWRIIPVSSGRVATELMKLERHSWVVSDWEAKPPPRRRFYRINDAHRDAVAALLGITR